MPHVLGVNVKAPSTETWTVILSAKTQAARPKKAEMAVKRMLD